MPNKLQNEQPKDMIDQHKVDAQVNLISQHVIQALGTPSDLRNVQVRKVWDDHYRVNVLVGVNAGSVKVANSYLVVTDSDGGVIGSTPKIVKQY
jgi:hypothetical protein